MVIKAKLHGTCAGQLYMMNPTWDMQGIKFMKSMILELMYLQILSRES